MPTSEAVRVAVRAHKSAMHQRAIQVSAGKGGAAGEGARLAPSSSTLVISLRIESARLPGLQFCRNPLLKLREVRMPHCEFFCQASKKSFSKILALVDYEEDEVLCPHCASKEVEQCVSAFSIIISKKSA